MTTPLGFSTRLLTAHRSALVVVAVAGIVLGVVALVWPRATLFTIAVIFGLYLLLSGVFRVMAAVVDSHTGRAARWIGGILGVFIVIAGVYCLANPARSLAVLVFVIGFGWLAEGVIDIMGALQGVVSPAWLAVVSGVVSIIAGIVAFTLPGLAVAAFLTFGAVLLIVVSVSTLLTLPRKNTVASA